MNLDNFSNEELLTLKKGIEALISNRAAEQNLCHKIKLEVEGGKVKTTSPYNSDFVTKARGLKGAWGDGKWAFNISVLEHVKNAMLECYGVTGEHPYETVVLIVKNLNDYARREGFELFGRSIAKAYGRDSGAKAQEDIFLVKGEFTSGGSVKNWQTVIKNATFEIHNFPKAALGREDVRKAVEEGWCSVK